MYIILLHIVIASSRLPGDKYRIVTHRETEKRKYR